MLALHFTDTVSLAGLGVFLAGLASLIGAIWVRNKNGNNNKEAGNDKGK